MESMFLTLIVYFYYHNFYCNVNCNADPTGEDTTRVLRLTCPYFILAVCLVHKPDDGLVNQSETYSLYLRKKMYVVPYQKLTSFLN